MHAKSRPAVVADKLTTKNFGVGTTGFSAAEDASVAVCVLPGTEIAFDAPVVVRPSFSWSAEDCKTFAHKTAIFRQINKDQKNVHHDALEFPDGVVVVLSTLIEDQKAVVLQLPAQPKTEAEASEQRRVEVFA